jgi:D-glycero-alpha-D-manno-heptose-7-phosphate kinase
MIGGTTNENWNLKKSLVKSISNSFIDECYEAAIRAGAIGGKIMGAGA